MAKFNKKLGSLESSSDLYNEEPKVLLIGYGWVGQYMGSYFKNAHYVEADGIIHSQDKEVIYNTEVLGIDNCDLKYDLAIISVPTPMNPKSGQCDTSIVKSVVRKYKRIVDIFLIKSTVEIGTTDHLKKKYCVKIAMSPEYIGETLGHPLLEPKRDAFQIIGGEEKTANKIAEYFRSVLNANAPIMILTANDAEIIKYCENLWIMQRVDYWNDVYDVCKAVGGNYNRVREGLVLDPRFSRTHSFIYPKNRGWSGKCLPKDMNALVYRMRKLGRPLQIVENQIIKNAYYLRAGYNNSVKLIPDDPLWEK